MAKSELIPFPVKFSRVVVLNEDVLNQFATGIRRVFFVYWPDAGDWTFAISPGHEWTWACDFDAKCISFSRSTFPEKDLLRTALISQIALAVSNSWNSREWVAHMERCAKVADDLGRPRLSNYLKNFVQTIAKGDIKMSLSGCGTRIETTVPNIKPSRASDTGLSSTVSEESTEFQDSLYLTFIDRAIARAMGAIQKQPQRNTSFK